MAFLPWPAPFLQARRILSFFESKVAGLIRNPAYPEASSLLANLFRSLVATARIVLADLEKEIQKELLKLEHLTATKTGNAGVNSAARLKQKIENNLGAKAAEIKRITRYFQELSALVRYIESSAVQDVPQSLLRYLSRGLQGSSPRFYLFIRRQWKPNFKYGEFISQLGNPERIPRQLHRLFKDVKFRIAMVSVPNFAIDNYFAACLVAHEVGHYYDEMAPLGDTYELDHTPVLPPSQLATINKLAYKWEKELTADVYASLLLGPAYAFALVEFESLRYDLDQSFVEPVEEAYPSLRMRLYFLIKALSLPQVDLLNLFLQSASGKKEKEGGRAGRLKGSADAVDIDPWGPPAEHLEQLKSLVVDESLFKLEGEPRKYAWRAVKDRAEKVVNYALSRLTNTAAGITAICHRKKFTDAVEAALVKLAANVPINEIVGEVYSSKEELGAATDQPERIWCVPKPQDVAVILNIGWMRYLALQELYARENDMNKRDDLFQQTEALKKVIKRSVDASAFHAEFLEQRALFGDQ